MGEVLIPLVAKIAFFKDDGETVDHELVTQHGAYEVFDFASHGSIGLFSFLTITTILTSSPEIAFLRREGNKRPWQLYDRVLPEHGVTIGYPNQVVNVTLVDKDQKPLRPLARIGRVVMPEDQR